MVMAPCTVQQHHDPARNISARLPVFSQPMLEWRAGTFPRIVSAGHACRWRPGANCGNVRELQEPLPAKLGDQFVLYFSKIIIKQAIPTGNSMHVASHARCCARSLVMITLSQPVSSEGEAPPHPDATKDLEHARRPTITPSTKKKNFPSPPSLRVGLSAQDRHAERARADQGGGEVETVVR